MYRLDPSLNNQGIFDATKHEMIFMQYISSFSRPVRGSLTHPGQCLDVVQGILRLEGRLARVEGDEAAACNRKKEVSIIVMVLNDILTSCTEIG